MNNVNIEGIMSPSHVNEPKLLIPVIIVYCPIRDSGYTENMVSMDDPQAFTRQIIRCICMLSILSVICLHGDPVVLSGGPENDYESWIIRTNEGNLMVIFCRNPDWQSGDLYVTFSTDNGITWEEPTAIIAKPQDQATLSFLQLPGDTFRLWYASNENITYGIFTAHSLDGTTWIEDDQIDLGWNLSDMHYDPTVIMEPDSSLTMSYRGPGGAYIAHKPYGGEWDTLRTLVGASGYRPRVMRHSNGTYLMTYHRNTYPGYEVFVRTSQDRVTWTAELRMTFDGNSHDPFLNEASDGAYVLYYATYVPPAYNLRRRISYDASNWEEEVQITFDATNNTQPHFFVEANETFLVWAHAVLFPDDHDVYFERTLYPGINETDLLVKTRTPIFLEAYPNPCSKQMKVVAPAHSQDAPDLEIYDAQGRIVSGSQQPQRAGLNVFLVPTLHLQPGVYFLQLYCTTGSYCKRFVVVH